jgi:hypothetical protein
LRCLNNDQINVNGFVKKVKLESEWNAMLEQAAIEKLQGQVDKLKRVGALGRSPAYVKLLDYLMEVTIAATPCSEMSVAFEVFNKNETFDVASDSTVRVYIYNLRRKLDTYYKGAGIDDEIRLSIPKGEYRLAMETIKPNADLIRYKNDGLKIIKPWIWPAVAAAIGAGLMFLLMLGEDGNEPALSDQQLAFWGDMLVDNKPILIVIGDYYIFGEQVDDLEMRLVREFDVNSASDLRKRLEQEEADNKGQYFDMGLTYLPRGSAYALLSVQQMLDKSGKKPRLKMMSEFSAEDLRANHVIYLGYLSGLGVLETYAFANSIFDIGYSYDDLVNTDSGQHYVSDFITAADDRNFVDYGVISSFTVGSNNQIVILAGTRDAGVMEMAELAIAPNVLSKMQLESDEGAGYMSVVEVYGFNLTNVSAKLINSEYINQERRPEE